MNKIIILLTLSLITQILFSQTLLSEENLITGEPYAGLGPNSKGYCVVGDKMFSVNRIKDKIVLRSYSSDKVTIDKEKFYDFPGNFAF